MAEESNKNETAAKLQKFLITINFFICFFVVKGNVSAYFFILYRKNKSTPKIN